MLEIDNDQKLMEELWAATTSKAITVVTSLGVDRNMGPSFVYMAVAIA